MIGDSRGLHHFGNDHQWVFHTGWHSSTPIWIALSVLTQRTKWGTVV